MDMHEYIDAAVSQIRARRARDMVARELEAHIEDQAAYCRAQGMSDSQTPDRLENGCYAGVIVCAGFKSADCL